MKKFPVCDEPHSFTRDAHCGRVAWSFDDHPTERDLIAANWPPDGYLQVPLPVHITLHLPFAFRHRVSFAPTSCIQLWFRFAVAPRQEETKHVRCQGNIL